MHACRSVTLSILASFALCAVAGCDAGRSADVESSEAASTAPTPTEVARRLGLELRDVVSAVRAESARPELATLTPNERGGTVLASVVGPELSSTTDDRGVRHYGDTFGDVFTLDRMTAADGDGGPAVFVFSSVVVSNAEIFYEPLVVDTRTGDVYVGMGRTEFRFFGPFTPTPEARLVGPFAPADLTGISSAINAGLLSIE